MIFDARNSQYFSTGYSDVLFYNTGKSVIENLHQEWNSLTRINISEPPHLNMKLAYKIEIYVVFGYVSHKKVYQVPYFSSVSLVYFVVDGWIRNLSILRMNKQQ